jgi:archaellum biogenesis ATPase FlaH
MAVSLDPEKLLVSKIIEEGSLSEAGDIQARFFSPGVYREAFIYITDYFREHGEVPSLLVMRNDCPDAKLVEVDTPWSDLLQRIKDKHIKGIMDSILDRAVQAADDGDIHTAVNLLGSMVGRIHNDVPMSRDVDLTQNGEERLAAYQERRNNPNTMVGIPSGFSVIDKATQGFQPGQLITLTGLPKTSKSVLALLMAKAAQEYGKKVLYVTYEMTCEEIAQRLDAYRAGINDMKLLSGNLSDDEWTRLTRSVHLTENLPTLVLSEDCMTVTAIGAKIDLLKPDIVIVDGVYMMEDEEGSDKNTPQALEHIVSGLKFMAMNRQICIVDVTQSNPDRAKGGKLNEDSIAGSRSFTRYSNLVMGVERTDDKNVRKLRVIMTRRGTPTEVLIMMDFDNGNFYEMENIELDDDLDRELMNDDDTDFAGSY